jgi:hypothetical protein
LAGGLCAFALAISAAGAATTPPKISGKYAVMVQWYCQHDIEATINNGNLTSLFFGSNRAGTVQAETGYWTFKPTTASQRTGQMTWSTTVISGSTGYLTGSGLAFHQVTENLSCTYGVPDADTLGLKCNGGGAGLYNMAFGNLVNGVAHDLFLAKIERPAVCMQHIHAIWQGPK